MGFDDLHFIVLYEWRVLWPDGALWCLHAFGTLGGESVAVVPAPGAHRRVVQHRLQLPGEIVPPIVGEFRKAASGFVHNLRAGRASELGRSSHDWVASIERV